MLDIILGGIQQHRKKKSLHFACLQSYRLCWLIWVSVQSDFLPKDFVAVAIPRWFRTMSVLYLKVFALDGWQITWVSHCDKNPREEIESLRRLQCAGHLRCHGNHSSEHPSLLLHHNFDKALCLCADTCAFAQPGWDGRKLYYKCSLFIRHHIRAE